MKGHGLAIGLIAVAFVAGGALVAGGFYLGLRAGIAVEKPADRAGSSTPKAGDDDSSVGPSKKGTRPVGEVISGTEPKVKDPESPPPVVPIRDRPEPPVVEVGTPSRVADLPEPDRLKAPPKAVSNKLRVRQNLKPGKTYETMTRGTICSRGLDRAWGFKSIVSINYAFEARIDREIVSNDGEAIVERRHFRDVKSVKLDVELEDLKLDIGQIHGPILTMVTMIWPQTAVTVRSFDGFSLSPVLGLLRSLGVRPEKLTGHDREAVKVFTQFDSLQGKSVEIEYRDGQGVTQVVPLVGAMTRSERFVHHHGVLVSDSLIFPNPDVEEDQTWSVDGSNFSNLIDPGLRAAVGGEVTMRRAKDLQVNGVSLAILKAEGGRLILTSSEPKGGEIGWFEPKGAMRFSPEDKIIVEASLSGKGELDRVGPTHLLFKTEMKQSPEITAFYTCRIVDTPPGSGR